MGESILNRLMLRGPTGERAGPLSHAEVAQRRRDGEINANWLCSSESADIWLPVDRVIDDPDIFGRLEAGGESYQRHEPGESAPRTDGHWTGGSRAEPASSQTRTPPSVIPSVVSEGNDLEGLKNWLAVLGLGLWLNFIRILSEAVQFPEFVSRPEVRQLRDQYASIDSAIITTYITGWSMLILLGICLFLYHSKHYLFPAAMIGTFIAGIILSVFDVAVWSNVSNGIGVEVLNETAIPMMVVIVGNMIGISYIAVSKRVEATFRKTYQGPKSGSPLRPSEKAKTREAVLHSQQKSAHMLEKNRQQAARQRPRRHVAVPDAGSANSLQSNEAEPRMRRADSSAQFRKPGPIKRKKTAVWKEPSDRSRYDLDGPLSDALDQPLVLDRSSEGPIAAVSAVVKNLKNVEGQRTGGFLKLTEIRRLGKTLYLKFEADAKPQEENALRGLFSELLRKEMVKDLVLQQGIVRIIVLYRGEIFWEASIRPGERGMTLKVID